MNNNNAEAGNSPTEISDLQERFIDQFVEQDSSWGHLLVSPVGMGKTYLSVSLANKLICEKGSQRLLFLIPAALLAHYENTLKKRLSMSVIILDRKKYRMLVDAVPVGSEPWPERSTIVTSIDLAMSQEISDSLSMVEWDIVVVDEAHMLRGLRLQFLNKLIDSSCVRRLLLLTATPLEFGLRDLKTTVWSHSQISMQPTVERNIIEYERTIEETMVLKDLENLIAAFRADNNAGKLAAHIIEMQAASSINVLENLLYSLRKSQDRDLRLSYPEGSERIFLKNGIEWSDKKEKLWDRVMDGIDQISGDSKLDMLQRFVSKLISNNNSAKNALCVFTRYRDTASYLEVGLDKFGTLSVFSVDRAIDTQYKEATVSNFLQKGGILILTDAAAQAFDLKEIDYLVHYDLPEKSTIFEQRIGRINRFGRTKPVKTYALHDILDSWPFETELLIKHGFISDQH